MHEVHNDVDADSADLFVLKLWCNKRGAYTGRSTPLPFDEMETVDLNTNMSRKERKSLSWISKRPEARSDCAGEDQLQYNRPTDRTMCQQDPLCAIFSISYMN